MDYDYAYNLAKKFSLKYLKKYKPLIMGSIKRKAPQVKDIDFLIVGEHGLEIYESLVKDKKIKIISAGTKKIMLEYEKKRIDIFFTPREFLIFAKLHFTGSKIFNIRMRSKAKELGYTLNQYGLFDEKNIPIKVKNEKEIFKILNMKYKKPEDRDH